MSKPDFVNVALLRNTLTALIESRTIGPDSPVVLSSDEEGNQYHQMFTYDIARFEGLDRRAIILIPAGEQLEPVLEDED